MQDRASRWLVQGHRLEYAWVIFAVINLAAMFAIIKLRVGHGMETVPFHFVYISFALMYGFRQWPRQGTVVGVIFVMVTTGLLTLIGITDGWEDAPEFSEVPLMSLMFMADGVSRRQAPGGRGGRRRGWRPSGRETSSASRSSCRTPPTSC